MFRLATTRAMWDEVVSRLGGLAGSAALQGAQDPPEEWDQWTRDAEGLLLCAGGWRRLPGSGLEGQRCSSNHDFPAHKPARTG